MTELLLGCGHRRDKLMSLNGSLMWEDLVTLDIEPATHPDIICDLDKHVWDPWPQNQHGMAACIHNNTLKRDYFDEVHAYEVLEHLGQQGHAPKFFSTFRNIWHVLKPGGFLYATCPSRFSPWVWGDPGHTRVIFKESLNFLCKRTVQMNRERGSPMTDYSSIHDFDFRIVKSEDKQESGFHIFILQAVK